MRVLSAIFGHNEARSRFLNKNGPDFNNSVNWLLNESGALQRLSTWWEYDARKMMDKLEIIVETHRNAYCSAARCPRFCSYDDIEDEGYSDGGRQKKFDSESKEARVKYAKNYLRCKAARLRMVNLHAEDDVLPPNAGALDAVSSLGKDWEDYPYLNELKTPQELKEIAELQEAEDSEDSQDEIDNAGDEDDLMECTECDYPIFYCRGRCREEDKVGRSS